MDSASLKQHHQSYKKRPHLGFSISYTGGCILIGVNCTPFTFTRSRNFILSTTNQPKKIEELPGPRDGQDSM
jgi:hypothetical protein